MKEKHPNKLQHKWTSYAGTGQNIFGKSLSFGHGRPGPILQIDNSIMQEHLATLSDDAKLELYEKLATGDLSSAKLAVGTMLGSSSSDSPATNATKKPIE